MGSMEYAFIAIIFSLLWLGVVVPVRFNQIDLYKNNSYSRNFSRNNAKRKYEQAMNVIL